MRFIQTHRFRKERKRLLKKLKLNFDKPEKYQYYLNKMEILYKGYKKYPEEDIKNRMDLYLRERGYKVKKVFMDEERDRLIQEASKDIKKDFQILMGAFKKLQGECNKKLNTFDNKLTKTQPVKRSRAIIS